VGVGVGERGRVVGVTLVEALGRLVLVLLFLFLLLFLGLVGVVGRRREGARLVGRLWLLGRREGTLGLLYGLLLLLLFAGRLSFLPWPFFLSPWGSLLGHLLPLSGLPNLHHVLLRFFFLHGDKHHVLQS
jgi:hypothetical protein